MRRYATGTLPRARASHKWFETWQYKSEHLQSLMTGIHRSSVNLCSYNAFTTHQHPQTEWLQDQILYHQQVVILLFFLLIGVFPSSSPPRTFSEVRLIRRNRKWASDKAFSFWSEQFLLILLPLLVIPLALSLAPPLAPLLTPSLALRLTPSRLCPSMSPGRPTPSPTQHCSCGDRLCPYYGYDDHLARTAAGPGDWATPGPNN